MKKLILSFFAIAMAMTVMAQGRREFNPEEMATRQATEIKTACNLSDEQYAAVRQLYLDSSNKMKAMRDSIAAAGGDFRTSFNMDDMRKRNEEQNAKIKAILTEEQYQAYEKLQAERRQRFGQGGPRRRQQQN